ncbi:EamA family transporter [Shewanella sp. VB17]|nr:EamA family transporter [Shewanella sp. VB17]
MVYLLVSTLIWSFSFSLIGSQLSSVDPYLAIMIRAALAMVFFLPFIKPMRISSINVNMMLVGAIQLGLMYCFYFNAFRYISVNEILLFNITTPIYLILIDNLIKKRNLTKNLILVICSVVGAYVIRDTIIGSDVIIGFLLIQGANLCFAMGQVMYGKVVIKNKQINNFAYFYFGAFLVSLIAYAGLGDANNLIITDEQLITLVYLGIVASGLGYYLWNVGSKLVTTTQLAIANNLLIPVGILVNITLWDGEFNLIKLTIGSVIIMATLYIDIKKARKPQVNLDTKDI